MLKAVSYLVPVPSLHLHCPLPSWFLRRWPRKRPRQVPPRAQVCRTRRRVVRPACPLGLARRVCHGLWLRARADPPAYGGHRNDGSARGVRAAERR
jgi:hypothetical protein